MSSRNAEALNLAGMLEAATSFLEALPEPAFVKDAASAYVWANQAWAGLMGLDPGSILGKTDADLFPPDTGLARSELTHHALISGRPSQEVIILEKHDRTKQHIQVTACPIVGPDGGPAAVLGTARDVTESFEAASEALGRTGCHDAMALCTRSLLMSRTSTEAISGFLHHLGEISRVHCVTVFENFTTPENELCFRPHYHWTSPVCKRTCRDRAVGAYGPWLVRWHEMLSMGLPVHGTLETLPPEETAVLAEDGIKSILLLPLDVGGRSYGFIRLAHCTEPHQWDESEVQLLSIGAESLSAFLMRMESDNALRRKIEEQEALWRGTPDLLYIKDKDSVYIMANPAFADFLAVPLDEIPGKTDFDLFPSDKASKFRSEDRAVVETGVTLRNVDETLTSADGQLIRAITTKVPLRDSTGAVVGVIGITRDVTERAELERQVRQAQKMESVGTLTAGIAHDFNNLLTSILGFAHLAMPKLDAADPVHRFLKHVISAGTRAQDLVQQLLTFSRQVEAERRPILLTPILKETVKFLRSTLPANVEILTVFPKDLPHIEADPTQMHQVVMNLCVNAAQAMPDGGTLTLRLRAVEEQARPGPKGRPVPKWVEVQVEDTGCGMDEATKARIFEPFFTTKEPGTGTGLGLSTVYGIVEDTGGTIGVESAPGRGAIFTVRLPATSTTARPKGDEPPTTSHHGTETVLFVEDQPDVLELGRETLQEAGYTVITAADGAEALSVFEQHRDEIDILVTDATMPRITGLQLIHHVLMSLKPDAKVVLCSGHVVREDDRRTIESAGGAILHKPFIPAQILATVRRVLDGERR